MKELMKELMKEQMSIAEDRAAPLRVCPQAERLPDRCRVQTHPSAFHPEEKSRS